MNVTNKKHESGWEEKMRKGGATNLKATSILLDFN